MIIILIQRSEIRSVSIPTNVFLYVYVYMFLYVFFYLFLYVMNIIMIFLALPTTLTTTVGFHNFNLRIDNLRVSNPNTFIVDVFVDTMSDFNVPESRPEQKTMKFRKPTVAVVTITIVTSIVLIFIVVIQQS